MLAVGVVDLTRSAPNRPIAGCATAAGVAAITAVMVLYRLLDPPGDLEVETGAWLGLLATVVVLCGTYYAMNEELAPAADSTA